VFASAGLAAAQTTPPATKADDKKMEDKKDTSMKKAPHHTAVGTVKTAGPDNNLVVAGKSKGKETEWTFATNEKTKVKKAGKEVTVKDLEPGDKVTVRYMDEGGKMTAMTVNASAAKQSAKAKDESATKK
jgi:3-dehydroquinate synthase class II